MPVLQSRPRIWPNHVLLKGWVEAWSQLLPEDKWAQPSADFTELSRQVEAASEQGKTFLGPVPLNWIAAVGVVLVVIGELLYEYYSLSPLQQWCQNSVWGDEPKGWELQAHHQQLAEVHGKPVLWRRGEQPARMTTMPVGPEPPANSLNLRLNLPGVESPNPDNLQVGLWGVTRGSQQELHEDLMAHAGLTQEEGSCRLDYALDPERVGDWDTLVLVVRITSQGASSPTATTAFEVFSRRDAVSPGEDWRPVEPLEGREASAWQAMPLAPWTA
ncbi:hypothetical protein RSO41_01420 [Halomonas sp. I1]|uniref:hypothetical protein n=1 Tax=Halomonas sp. I1 TaxID=393536 RepID=UPI0028DE3951|nr:hypothetical protein [Halomonas sp. I1]MDT8893300.1 hypothetical protein [Halomonas sp. I1]